MSLQIIMSLLVTRAPDSTLAKPAMEQLDVIMELFTEAAPTSGVASANLVRICLPSSVFWTSHLPEGMDSKALEHSSRCS
jgi:hypothetical protein